MPTENPVDIISFCIYNVKALKNASVAQSVVHLTRNEKVACSSQVTSSKTRSPMWAGFSFLLFPPAADGGLFDSQKVAEFKNAQPVGWAFLIWLQ